MNQKSANGLEELTRAYGSEIFARLNRTGPILLSSAWFDDQMMALSMADEAIKVQLFRFIDALPLLKTPQSIARHLREYFAEVPERLPTALRFLLQRLPAHGLPGRTLAWLARVNAERLAHKFMAGSNLTEALRSVARLRKHHQAFTIDLLGEATITETEADGYARQYIELLAGLTREVNSWPEDPAIDRDQNGPIPRVNVSIKLSSLYSQFDPIDPAGTSRAVCERLRPILRLARANEAFVNFDMEQFSLKDETLRIFREILREPEFHDWPHVGIAIQAYLHETECDLQQLLDWVRQRGTSVWVRLVKGAYWDYETVIAAQNHWPVPVFTEKPETDANYEDLSRFLLENHEHLRPAFGSHNVRSLAFVMALAHQMELPKGSFEFQMLYGMADPVKDALVGMGQRLRIYAPFGQLLPGMAYLVRRLLENTSNESFLRASFQEHKPEVQLLMNPRHHVTHVPAQGDGGNDRHFQNEPVADFSREEKRRAMQDALRDVTSQFGRHYQLIINGEEAEGGGRMESHNPSHWKQIIGTFALARREDAEAAIAVANAAFPAWRETPAEERTEYLFAAAREMRRRRFELAAWEVYECGKPWREADADVAEAIDFCEYYAHEMIRLANPIRHDVPGEDNEYCYEPRGVTVVIAPWNFPLGILCGMTTAALVTGNPVIMKPAEQSSVVAAKLMEIFRAIDMPKGVIHYLPGIGEEVGPTLVNHSQVAVIAFTGSRGVGLALNHEASSTPAGQDHVKRVIAEMGGKNAIIVDADADLDEAVKGVVESAFVYAGQKCSACSRAVVLEPIYDAFLPRLIEATRSLKIASADDPGCFVGPVIDMEARDRILGMIEKGKQEAKLAFAAAAGNLAQQGSFVPPHVFADVSPQAMIAREEIFGPVLAVIRARHLPEALDIANGASYALTGGLFSRSPESIRNVRRQFRVGNLYINRKITGALVERQPFGGFKLSGIGSKAGGPDYLLQFLLPRSITENTMRHGFTPVASDASMKSR